MFARRSGLCAGECVPAGAFCVCASACPAERFAYARMRARLSDLRTCECVPRRVISVWTRACPAERFPRGRVLAPGGLPVGLRVFTWRSVWYAGVCLPRGVVCAWASACRAEWFVRGRVLAWFTYACALASVVCLGAGAFLRGVLACGCARRLPCGVFGFRRFTCGHASSVSLLIVDALRMRTYGYLADSASPVGGLPARASLCLHPHGGFPLQAPAAAGVAWTLGCLASPT